ncbi:transposase [Paenibacillus thermoaerophilus]|uniref:Transposase n=1 Tax=Paenibacillus thermoaerophilus TaxID=1215385 RepID=A0ABW2V412_9BACL|nr:transposase [Paenibacillus thermoaerophilus]TMV10452.1 IS1595 family transposase [Paenibacillus thermoaerophilus]
MEFLRFPDEFHSEESCALALFAAKWPNGYVCPRCGSRQCCRIETRRLPLFQCAHCRHQTSLIANTVMSRSRTPLTKWFQALYLMTRPLIGVSASTLKLIIGVTYKTAWLMLHKIRHEMSEYDRRRLLTGVVRAIPGIFGSTPYPLYDSIPAKYPVIMGMSLQNSKQPASIKLISTDRSATLNDTIPNFRSRHVCPNCADFEVIRSIRGATEWGFTKKIFVMATMWIGSLYYGVSQKHLQKYLDEYVYRYNCAIRNESMLTGTLKSCSAYSAITYRELIGKSVQSPRQNRDDLPCLVGAA